MAMYRSDCPRCGTKNSTFDVVAQNSLGIFAADWVERFELPSVCRHCRTTTVFILENKIYDLSSQLRKNNGIVGFDGYINKIFHDKGYVSVALFDADSAPQFTPESVSKIYDEASTCVVTRCWNAAGAMFRTTIDLTTKGLLPPEDEEPSSNIRKSMGLRLKWMFDTGKLPPELRELAQAIQLDGNDGVHDGTLTEADALDLQDFTRQLLHRIFTVPGKIEEARLRREARRGSG